MTKQGKLVLKDSYSEHLLTHGSSYQQWTVSTLVPGALSKEQSGKTEQILSWCQIRKLPSHPKPQLMVKKFDVESWKNLRQHYLSR